MTNQHHHSSAGHRCGSIESFEYSAKDLEGVAVVYCILYSSMLYRIRGVTRLSL